MVIEDAPAGVEAAHRAGAKAVAVLRHHPLDAFPRPEAAVERLEELSLPRLRRLVESEPLGKG